MNKKSEMELDGWMYTCYQLDEGESLGTLMQEVADAYDNAGLDVEHVKSTFTPKHDALTCSMWELTHEKHLGTHGVEVKWRLKNS